MPYNRMLGIALALSICGAVGAPRVEASKVTVGAPVVRKDLPAEPRADRDETAVVPHEAMPSLHTSPKEPVKYDALPEKERKTRSLDEILGTVAEV